MPGLVNHAKGPGCPESSGKYVKGFKERARIILVLQRLCRSDWKKDKSGRLVRILRWYFGHKVVIAQSVQLRK